MFAKRRSWRRTDLCLSRLSFFNLSSVTHASQTVLLDIGDVPDDQSTVQKEVPAL